MAVKRSVAFEERLSQLETLISRMERGEMPLEETMQQYEASLKLLKTMEKELATAQQRLTVLRQKDGENVEVPMEEKE